MSRITTQADLVVASDIHIRDPRDARTAAFLKFVGECMDAKVKRLVINGDMFDFFFGPSKFFIEKYSEVFDSLSKLAKSGCEIYYGQGNHEFALEHHAESYLRHFGDEGFFLQIDNGPKVYIEHGDMLINDPKYRLFRGLIRSPFANLAGKAIPQSLLDRWTSWFASSSRKKDQYRTLDHNKVIAAATQKARTKNCDLFVFGHFHHPYDQVIDGKIRLLCVDMWDKPSCIVVKGHKISRVSL